MDVDQPIKICRRELLIPGELLPDAPPGKHHGTVTKTFDSKDGPAVVVKLTDFRRVSVTLPLDAVLPCLLPKQERAPRVGEDISAPRQQKKNSNSNKKKKGRPKGSSGAATGAHLSRKRRREAEDAGADDPVGVSGVAPPPSIPQCGPQLLQLLRKLESVVRKNRMRERGGSARFAEARSRERLRPG